MMVPFSEAVARSVPSLFSAMQESGSLAKQGSRDDNEKFVAHLLLEGYLALDFSCTAYATNVYCKLGSRASLVLQGVSWHFACQPCAACLHVAHCAAWSPGVDVA